MSFISSFEITKVHLKFQNNIYFFEILHLLLKIAAVKPNNLTGFMTDFNNGNPVFNNGPRILPKNPPDWIILDI